METWKFDDGGRKAAGYAGKTGDCVFRAIAIATGTPYPEVARMVAMEAMHERPRSRLAKTGRHRGFFVRKQRSSMKTGVHKATIDRIMQRWFPTWKWTATMTIGSGCKVHVKASELPKGRIMLSLSKHVAAMVDGVVHDTHDPSRSGTRCVYGYWSEQ